LQEAWHIIIAPFSLHEDAETLVDKSQINVYDGAKREEYDAQFVRIGIARKKLKKFREFTEGQ